MDGTFGCRALPIISIQDICRPSQTNWYYFDFLGVVVILK